MHIHQHYPSTKSTASSQQYVPIHNKPLKEAILLICKARLKYFQIIFFTFTLGNRKELFYFGRELYYNMIKVAHRIN